LSLTLDNPEFEAQGSNAFSLRAFNREAIFHALLSQVRQSSSVNVPATEEAETLHPVVSDTLDSNCLVNFSAQAPLAQLEAVSDFSNLTFLPDLPVPSQQ
jgi:hypothetical protein